MENGHAPREGAELVEQPRQRGEAPPAHATRWPFHRSRSGPADDEEILLGPEPD